MKKIVLIAAVLLSFSGKAQIFNRSLEDFSASGKPVIVHRGNNMVVFDAAYARVLDTLGNVIATVSIPDSALMQAYTEHIGVLERANGDIIVYGNYDRACDGTTDVGVYLYSFSINNTFTKVKIHAQFLQRIASVIEMDNNRLFVSADRVWAVLNDQFDTLKTGMFYFTANLVIQTCYLGGDSLLFQGGNRGTIYKLKTTYGVITNASLGTSAQLFSISDTTFGLLNRNQRDVFVHNKSNLARVDSFHVNFPQFLIINQVHFGKDALVLHDANIHIKYAYADFSQSGFCQNLSSGGLSQQNLQAQLSYHKSKLVLVSASLQSIGVQVGVLNNPVSNIVSSLALTVTNINTTVENVDSSEYGLTRKLIYTYKLKWNTKIKNNASQVIDSVRIAHEIPFVNICTTSYETGLKSYQRIGIGQTITSVDSMLITQKSLENNLSFVLHNRIAMANGQLVGYTDAYQFDTLAIENVSMAESRPLSKISVYPNPVTTKLFVDAGVPIKAIEILNMQGETVRSLESKNGISQISVEGLAKGIYLVKLKTDDAQSLPAGGVVVNKIVVE